MNVIKPVILVVEDDMSSQMLFKYFLKDSYDLFFAESVTKAKNSLEEHSVDLILLDLSLEGEEDGLDLVRYLRQTTAWKDIPTIATTAHAFTTDRDNCLAAGCNDFLSKPIQREVLLERVAHHLSLSDK
ncbi:MAG: response regulator [Fidelibacterota bacterium]